MIVDGYPLQFPVGWKRTLVPERARFGEHSVAQAVYNLKLEVERLGGKNLVISTNLMLKIDGLPYSNQKTPVDTGVAVYFDLKGKQQCFPCDRWKDIGHNIWAIYKSIEAIRGLERWGAKEMVESAFKGFQALPSPEQVTNTKVRYFLSSMSLDEARDVYRNLLLVLHPDKGGSQEDFMELQRQYNQFKQSFSTQ